VIPVPGNHDGVAPGSPFIPVPGSHPPRGEWMGTRNSGGMTRFRNHDGNHVELGTGSAVRTLRMGPPEGNTLAALAEPEIRSPRRDFPPRRAYAGRTRAGVPYPCPAADPPALSSGDAVSCCLRNRRSRHASRADFDPGVFPGDLPTPCVHPLSETWSTGPIPVPSLPPAALHPVPRRGQEDPHHP
jgi:hypothetical protein